MMFVVPGLLLHTVQQPNQKNLSISNDGYTQKKKKNQSLFFKLRLIYRHCYIGPYIQNYFSLAQIIYENC